MGKISTTDAKVCALLREYYTISRKIDELVGWLHPGMCVCEQCLAVNKEIRDLCARQLEIVKEVNYAEQRAARKGPFGDPRKAESS